MDDATRAELDSLRRRAYAPAPEVPLESDELGRLVELEELALPAAPPARFPADEAPPVAAPPVEAPQVAADSTPPASARDRKWMPRLHPAAAAAIIATCAAVILGGGALIGGFSSPSQTMPSNSPDMPARMIVRVQIDESTGAFEHTAGVDAAPFPDGMQISWAQSLGTYYGWSVWIGGGAFSGAFSSEDQDCLLVTDGSQAPTTCAPATSPVGAGLVDSRPGDEDLVITLPDDGGTATDRPPEMTDGQRVDVAWGQGGFVTITRG